MTIIYQMDDFFSEKAFHKKWEIVKRHYEASYHCLLKPDLLKEQMLELIRKYDALGRAQYLLNHKD